MAGWPDLACGRYETLLAFDHHRREVLAIGPTTQARGARLAGRGPPRPRGRRRSPTRSQTPDPAATKRPSPRWSARIAAGEIFQANLARAWTGRLAPGARPFDLFARLAGASAAPFAAYLRLPGLALVSNSPERFLRVTPHGDGAGRRDPADQGHRRRAAPRRPRTTRLAAALAASQKDRAENLMIVDLMRNDLARVSTPGTVRVPALFAVERFANVSHLVSTVTATLAPARPRSTCWPPPSRPARSPARRRCRR